MKLLKLKSDVKILDKPKIRILKLKKVVKSLESYESSTRDLLVISLETAVPLWIYEIRKRIELSGFDELLIRAKELSQIIASEGDNILYKSKKKGGSARAFNALAESLAIGSFFPGGITLFGLHFEETIQ